MNHASCTPELSNGGSIDFGTIALDQLSPNVVNQMGQKDMSLTINCPAATRVAWSIADNKEDSNAANDLTSSQFYIRDGADNGNDVWGAGTTYGVGFTSVGEKLVRMRLRPALTILPPTAYRLRRSMPRHLPTAKGNTCGVT